MKLGIEGRRAVITAGSRGLGRSIAEALAAEGVRVAPVARTASHVHDLVRDLGGEAAGHHGIVLDAADEGAPARLADGLKAAGFWPVDIAVHNLGGTLDVADPYCPVQDWRRVWRVNLEAAVELNLLLLPEMRRRRWGRILHISSIASMENHGPVPYCSVKAALTAYTRSMGRVVSPDGVIMTAILPGAVMTEGGYWDQASRERPDHVRKYLEDRMAIHRFGRPEEIGRAAAFLCSEHASFFVGSIVPIDGGQGRGYFGH